MGGATGNKTIPLLVLAGPTAAGKSALALQVARCLDTDLISADSAQVYRGLDIGTAKPTAAEQKMVKHHLIDLVDPDQPYNVAAYQEDATKVIRSNWDSGRLPFLVGGTGLYIRAVTAGYRFGEQGASPGLRSVYHELADRKGPAALHRELQAVDPQAAAKIQPGDRRRIIRALEVFHLEGRPISRQVKDTTEKPAPYRVLFFVLTLDRKELYIRIEERVEAMLAGGLPAEVKQLLEQGYHESDPGLQVLGYRQMVTYLQGRTGYQEAVAAIKQQTRNLAKRQLTWFRREPGANWLEGGSRTNPDQLVKIICNRVKDLQR